MEHEVMGAQVKDGPRVWPEWQHKITSYRPYEKGRMVVTAGLHYLQGNRLPYFSVTCAVFNQRGRDVGGGAMHREILKLWPGLAPVVALHLSDSEGVPMHPEDNGWYWLAGYYGGAGEQYHGGNGERQHWKEDGTFDGYRLSTPDECLDVFAQRVRVPVEEARRLAEEWQRGIEYSEAKREFVRWSLAQRPRWKAEADAAIALLDGGGWAETTKG